MRRPLLCLPFALLLACARTPPAEAPGPEQRETVTRFCDVDALAHITPESEPLSVGARRTEWLTAHVDTPDGIYLRTMLSVKGAAEQAAMLREEAQRSGLAKCALADSLEAEGTGGLSP